jgi:hypothetical protein
VSPWANGSQRIGHTPSYKPFLVFQSARQVWDGRVSTWAYPSQRIGRSPSYTRFVVFQSAREVWHSGKRQWAKPPQLIGGVKSHGHVVFMVQHGTKKRHILNLWLHPNKRSVRVQIIHYLQLDSPIEQFSFRFDLASLGRGRLGRVGGSSGGQRHRKDRNNLQRKKSDWTSPATEYSEL